MKELQLSNRSYSQINYLPSLDISGPFFVDVTDDIIRPTMNDSGPPSQLAPSLHIPPKIKIFAGIGAEDTPDDICKEMTRFATMMAKKGWILRSGGAPGADTAFEKGYEEYPGLKEIYLPWKGFNKNPSPLHTVSQQAINIAAKHHPAWNNVIKKEASVKLLGRDSYQILGLDLNSPCDLVVCWTKDGKKVGGTAQAMRIAEAWNIKIMNLAEYKVK